MDPNIPRVAPAREILLEFEPRGCWCSLENTNLQSSNAGAQIRCRSCWGRERGRVSNKLQLRDRVGLHPRQSGRERPGRGISFAKAPGLVLSRSPRPITRELWKEADA